MDYTITSRNLQIRKSYLCRVADMMPTLQRIRQQCPDSDVWRRSIRSLRAEWIVHNVCYRLHILRSHTADVDLNYPNRVAWLYICLAPLARLIIK